MGQKSGKSDGVTGYEAKRDILLRYLPMYGFVVAKAARKAKYAESYINSGLHKTLAGDKWFCKERDRLLAECLGLSEDKVEALDRKIENYIDRKELTPAELCKLGELYYRRKGALQDKTIIETTERERELTASARKEARRLSIVLMKEQSKGTETVPKAS